MTGTKLNNFGRIATVWLLGILASLVVFVTPASAQVPGGGALSIPSVRIVEGDSGQSLASITIRIVSSTDPSSTLVAGPAGAEIAWAPVAGSASAGTDFLDSGPAIARIAAGTSSVTVTVPILGDTAVEPDETFAVEASLRGGFFRTTGVVTILNDDAIPAPINGRPNLSISDVQVTETNFSSPVAAFSISLSSPAPSGGVSFRFATSNGTATAGADYVALLVPVVTIPEGAMGTEVAVTISPDFTYEGDETFFANVSAVTGATVVDGQGVGTIIDDDVPFVPPNTLNISGVMQQEGNAGTTNFDFVARLIDPAGPGGVRFNVVVSSGTAQLGSDFNAPAATAFTIPAGQTQVVISVPVLGDTTPELAENFNLELQSVTGAIAGFVSATGTILNDDALPMLSIADLSQNEGNSGNTTFNFQVTLSEPAGSGGVSFEANVFGSSAVAGTDFVQTTRQTYTIPAGATSATVPVQVIGDQLPESDETFNVSLELTRSSIAEISRGFATGTILNDDGTPPTLQVTGSSANEGNSGITNFVFTATLSAPAGPDGVSFVPTAGGMTATPGTDFGPATPSTVTIPAGSRTATFTVPVFGDTIPEPDEGILVFVNNVIGATPNPLPANVTIINDDGPPPTLTLSGVSVNEGNSGRTQMAFPFTLSSPAPPGGISLVVGVSGNTAVNGVDYVVPNPNSLIIPAGSTSANFIVEVIGDLVPEANETFSVSVFPVNMGTVIIPNSSVVGTILNDDGILPNISVANVSQLEGTGGTTDFVFTVQLSSPAGPSGVVFDALTFDGTATAATDYTAINLIQARIPPGASSTTITVRVAADMVGEADESFTVLLRNIVGASLSQLFATATIRNDDGAIWPTLNAPIAGSSQAEGTATASPARIQFTLTGPAPAGGISFDVSTASSPFNNATAGVDYTALTATRVTIPQGQTVGTVTVPITPDALFEDPETFTIVVSNVSAGAVLGNATSTHTITNDDVAPVLSVTGGSASEGTTDSQSVVFTVSLSAPSGRTTTANFDTGSGTALANVDFLGFSGLVSIPAGSTSGTVTIVTFPDREVEPDETFELLFSGVSGATPGTTRAIGTILNDDVIEISISDAFIVEGNSGTADAVFQINLSQQAGAGGVSFDVATGPATPGAGEVAAEAGSDFTAVQRTALTIPAGERTTTVRVPVIGDRMFEADEVFAVTVSNPVNAIIGTGTALGSIANDDQRPTVSVTDTSVVEGDAGSNSLQFQVQLSAVAGTPVEVGFRTQDQTAVAGQDYTARAGRITIPAGSMSGRIDIAVIGDDSDETTESMRLVLDSALGADIGSPSAAIGLIVDDDTILTVSPGTIPGAQVGVAYTQSFAAIRGTAPYLFAIAGRLPAGMSFSDQGVLTGTPVEGGVFELTVLVSDSTAAPVGPFVGTQTFVLNVAPATIVLPASVLPPGRQASPYDAAIELASGGTAPYRYTVTGGALPTGLALDPQTGAISGTPSVFGQFTFTVTAMDSSIGTGPFATSQTYQLFISQLPPTVANSSLTVAYNAAPTPVPLALSGGPAESVALVTAPANGSVGIEGTQIIYQPRSGFSGTDSFTYTASNAGGTSAPATVTVTVRPPEFTVTAVGELAGTAGVPFSLTFEFAGGTAPFSFYQVTGLPAGVTITGTTATSVTVSGTPTAVGSFAIEATARDSSTGDGPFTVTGTATLTMAPPVLVLQPGSPALSATYATAFSQVFTATGGSGAFNYVQTGTLPPGLTFNAATGTLSGTPTASGSYSFTITATDRLVTGVGAPFSVSRTYTVAIAAPVITVTPTTLPGATAGRAYSATLVAAGAVGPYSFTLVDGRLPPGITLSSAGVLSGTPTASGSFPLALRVRDANGETGTVNLTISVAVPTLTITPAVLPEANQGLAYTQTITASGGIAPYSYAVSAGALPEGLTLNATTGVISGTPLGSGAASFTITVTDSTGGTPARASVAYVLQIVARPDPARDPEVQALTQSQVQSARRLSDAQIGNFRSRLGWLRPGNGGGSGGGGSGGGGSGGASLASGGGFQNSVRIMAMDPCAPQANSWSVSPCARALGSPGVHGLSGFGAGPFQLSVAADGTVNAAAGAGDGSAGGPPPATGGTGVERPWSVWASGTIRYGDVDPQTGVASQSFEADGLTLGADYRYSDRLAVGVGLGFGNDIVTVGTNGSRSRTQAVTAATYGSYLLGGGYFTDWVVGYQWLDLDLQRYVTSTGSLIRSRRSGTQLFLSASAGADVDVGSWRISPYGRFDIARGSLDAYRENSGSLFDLSYGEQTLDYAAVGVGSTFRTVYAFEGGQFLPQLSLEYLYDLDRQEAARVGYVERSNGAFSTIALTGIDREQLSVGLGFEVQWDTGSTVGLDYLTRFSSGIGSDETWQLNARFQF